MDLMGVAQLVHAPGAGKKFSWMGMGIGFKMRKKQFNDHVKGISVVMVKEKKGWLTRLLAKMLFWKHPMFKKPWHPIICVHFDGVIHSCTSGWHGIAKIEDPIVPGAIKWLMSYLPTPESISHFDPYEDGRPPHP